MEMSDDSITSIEQQGPPPDWGVNIQNSNLPPPVVMLAPARSNGVGSPNENGEFLSCRPSDKQLSELSFQATMVPRRSLCSTEMRITRFGPRRSWT